MLTVAETLTRLVAEAALRAGLPAEGLEPCLPAGQGHGADYQSNAAFRLAKLVKQPPRAVAERLAAHLPEHPALAGAAVAGPGFLNLTLRESFLADQVEARRADPRFGSPETGRGRTVVIDYSSPNVAKRMHIAHLRSTVIGNALDRIHRWLGWRVIADNHIGDWGTPFGKLIVAWRGWRDEAAFQADPIGELQRLYQSFKDHAAQAPELEDQARAETAKLQAGDPANRALWAEFVRVSLAEFERVYQRLGVRFDVTLGESHYQEELAPLVQELLDLGIAVEDDGAVVVWFEPAEKGVGKGPLVIRKRDGAALYGTTDLATVRYRLRTWAPDLILYVTDLRQQEHFRQVFATCRRWGHTTDLRHVPFGILRFPSGAIAATRTGEVQNLVDVLDAAVARARGVLEQRSAQLSEEEREGIAEAVGVAAVRYFDLSQNPASDITFDLEKSLSLEANSAPYLLYGLARCRSLLRRGGQEGPLRLVAPEERELALALVRLPEVIQLAAATCRPNLLCDHLYALVQSLSRFWEQCRVFGEGVPVEVSASRLRLVAATARALEEGFGCLGLPTVDRL